MAHDWSLSLAFHQPQTCSAFHNFLLAIKQKISGKGDSDEITAGRQERLHREKQYVMLYVASYAERDVTVLDSKTGSVTSD